FWLLGLLNNAPWVLMLACATNISDGGVALVVSSSVSSVYHAGACSFPSYFFCIHHHQFIANQVPGLIVKITAPYWFHRVSYKARLLTASLSMGLACFLVGDQWFGLFFELIGVSFISLQCNLGEASILALAGKFDSTQQNRCITAFSSGTGLAGIVGYGYKAFLSEVFGWGLSYIVWSAIGFAFFYWQIYHTGYDNASLVEMVGHHQHRESRNTTSAAHRILSSASANTDLTAHDRFKLVLSLWPYTIPLFTVYAAEYMLQAGVWSAIGFPCSLYYQYQFGMFLSRSSGNMFSVPLPILWLMPLLQVTNLLFFWLDSVHHWWYDYTLLFPCFFAGLLGGAVYVQGYSRINADFPLELREFAISSAGVADSLGILVADISSL
ncbi:cln3-like protein, partial [Thalassiosira pseudonana CCMP1335]